MFFGMFQNCFVFAVCSFFPVCRLASGAFLRVAPSWTPQLFVSLVVCCLQALLIGTMLFCEFCVVHVVRVVWCCRYSHGWHEFL